MSKQVKISTNKSKYVFNFYDELWVSEIITFKESFSFEIYGLSFDNICITRILEFVEKDSFYKIKNKGKEVLNLLAIHFWGEEYKDSIFDFQGIVVDLESEEELGDFQLYYHMISKSNEFEDFANWILDIKDFKITGARRKQL